MKFPIGLCRTASYFRYCAKIAKGECRDKRKPRFRFDYDEPQPIFVLTKIVKVECRDKRKSYFQLGYAETNPTLYKYR